MTPQEIFDKAYTGVIAQNCKSNDHDKKVCFYFKDENTRCGVGHLLTEKAAKSFDNMYKRGVDSSIGYILANRRSKFIEPWMKENTILLQDIQKAHDNTIEGDFFIKTFKENMSGVRIMHNLEVPA